VPIKREKTPGDLTPSAPDYETIGEIYDEIRACLIEFAASGGGDSFAHTERQLSPAAAKLPGMRIIRTIQDALAAIETIIEQGEGSSCGNSNCHFSCFQALRTEWARLVAGNPSFVPISLPHTIR
jgi:hypothetical protein